MRHLSSEDTRCSTPDSSLDEQVSRWVLATAEKVLMGCVDCLHGFHFAPEKLRDPLATQ